MDLCEEKPLLKIGGKPIIEHVFNALRNAKEIDEIIVAVSKYTPKTATLMKRCPVKVLETPGNGYVPDQAYAIRRLKLDIALIISADLPLVTGEIVERIIERYRLCSKPALTVAVPLETKKRLGLGAEYAVEVGDRLVVPSGVNVIDGRRIDETELDEEIFIIDEEELAVNVNTSRELGIAEYLFEEDSVRAC